jgi:hypothetical protein
MSIFEAFDDLSKNANIICKTNFKDCSNCATNELDDIIEKEKDKIGYTYWTEEDEVTRIQRNLFYLGFNKNQDLYNIDEKDIAQTICEYLTKHNVKHLWSGEVEDKILIIGEGGQ